MTRSISRVGGLVFLVWFVPMHAFADQDPEVVSVLDSADPEDQTQLIEAIERTYSDVSTVSASFTQVQRSVMGEVEQRGRLQIKRPRMARWEFEGPNSSQMVTNGSTVWVYTPATQQVIETNSVGQTDGVMQLLDDLGRLEEHFEVTRFERPDGGYYLVDLQPRTAANYRRIEVVFSPDGYVLHRVLVVDAMDGEIELTFSDIEYNQEMADSDFEFVVPEGAQVIRGGL